MLKKKTIFVVLLGLCGLYTYSTRTGMEEQEGRSPTPLSEAEIAALLPRTYQPPPPKPMTVEQINEMLDSSFLGFMGGTSGFSAILQTPISMMKQDPDGRRIVAALGISRAETLVSMLGLDWRINAQDGLCQMFGKEFESVQKRSEFAKSVTWRQFLLKSYELINKNYPERIQGIDFQQIMINRSAQLAPSAPSEQDSPEE